MNKAILVFILSLLSVVNSDAQNRGGQGGFAGTKLIYQSWSQEQSDDFQEFSVPIMVYYPLNRQFSVTVRGYAASVSGDKNLAGLSGLADTQLGLSYFLPTAHLTFNIGLNAPTGKTELSLDEFQTSSLISSNIFNMQVPTFGQGLNATAGFTWAIPAGRALVLGVGAAYQIKGGYKPLSGFVEDYVPGSELLATTGFEWLMGENTSFSSDATLTNYSADKIGTAEVFSFGNRLMLNAQFRHYFNFDELWLMARYRTRNKSELPSLPGGGLSPETTKSSANQIEFVSHYRHRFSQSFHGRVMFEGRLYQQAAGFVSLAETPAAVGVSLLGFGLAPELAISRNLRVPIFLKYFTGSFDSGPHVSGVEVGTEFWISF